MAEPDLESRWRRRMQIWQERAEIASRNGQQDVSACAGTVASFYAMMLSGIEIEEPPQFKEINLLRKRIEAGEQHRTMAAEHGLSDEAIDSTLEIQQLEKQLVAAVESWSKGD